MSCCKIRPRLLVQKDKVSFLYQDGLTTCTLTGVRAGWLVLVHHCSVTSCSLLYECRLHEEAHVAWVYHYTVFYHYILGLDTHIYPTLWSGWLKQPITRSHVNIIGFIVPKHDPIWWLSSHITRSYTNIIVPYYTILYEYFSPITRFYCKRYYTRRLWYH